MRSVIISMNVILVMNETLSGSFHSSDNDAYDMIFSSGKHPFLFMLDKQEQFIPILTSGTDMSRVQKKISGDSRIYPVNKT